MKNLVTISTDLCKGCFLCGDACPKKILEIDKTGINAKGYNPITVTEMEKCTACSICARMCPDSVIKVERG